MVKYVISTLVLAVCLKNSGGVTFISSNKLDKTLQVSTRNGIVQGRKDVTYMGKEYWVFQGIPYARPPVGNLRFRGPKPCRSWSGVLDGTKEGPECVQIHLRPEDVTSDGEEDCLYLNVFSPRNPHTTGLLPVLVWIQGGAFLQGESSADIYGPDNIMEQNIILVTFNYRLGLFGFLSTEDMASPGNYGLKDQNLVLRWIQENIKGFGGDKGRVTISGHSAGAASVFYHVLSPKSKGLFRGGIAQSGSTLCAWAVQQHPRSIPFDLGTVVGINTNSTKQLVAQLRKIRVDKLKAAAKPLILLNMLQVAQGAFPFSPTIEPLHKQAFMTEKSYGLLERGNFARVPVLMGITSVESIFFAKLIDFLKPLSIIYELSPGSLPSPAMNINSSAEKTEAGLMIKGHYFKSRSVFDGTKEELLYYIADDRFVRPITKTAQLISKYVPVYFYLFSYVSNYGLKGVPVVEERPLNGVSHTEEQWYLWKNSKLPVPWGYDRLVTSRMTKLWTNFVKTGNPTPVLDELLENVTWPAVNSTGNMQYLRIDKSVSVDQNFRAGHLRFWDRVYRQYGNPPFVTY